MTKGKRFAISASGVVYDRKRFVDDGGRLLQIDKRGGKVRRRGNAPLDPIVQRGIDEARARRAETTTPIVWPDDCPF